MEKVYVFNKSVRGHLHVLKEIPCEDYSCSYSDEQGRFQIISVADGHGAEACFRSNIGSKAACIVACECLKSFAKSIFSSADTQEKFYSDILDDKRTSELTLRRLTDIITARWYDEVMFDYEENKPTEEEMALADGKDPLHIYGTTLIAALRLERCLVLIQQGDGRCEVFYSDGSVDQPIPWDDRCQDTTTTSMCDSDVLESFRTKVIDLREQEVIACFLACDGVEDAYRDTYEDLGGSHCIMGGVHAFFKDMICRIVKEGTEDFENGLQDYLTQFSEKGRFSRSGSGDDVSVAGIMELDKVRKFVEKFEYDARIYDIDESIFWKETELRGKQRKREILRKRMIDSERAYTIAKSEYQSVQKRIEQVNEARTEQTAKKDTLINCIAQFNNRFNELIASNETDDETEDAETKNFLTKIKDMLHISHSDDDSDENIRGYLKLLENDRDNVLDELKSLNRKFADLEFLLKKRQEHEEEMQESFLKAKKAFDDYDSKFQLIEDARQKLLDEKKEITQQ